MGLEMVQLLDGSRTAADVARHVAEHYGADEELVERDARAFLLQLYECNLLENLPRPRVEKPAPKPKPPSLTIYVTEQCNLRCKHCAIVEGKMPDPLITEEDIRRLVDEHTTNYSNPTVNFLGGEPFMHPAIMDLLAYARERSDQVNVSTNGFYVNEEKARRLVELGILVQVSLDGADPEVHDFIRGRNAFEKALRAIDMICDAGGGPRLTIASSLTRCMLQQVKELIARCDRRGIGKIRFLPLNKTKAAETNWEHIGPDHDEMRRVIRYLIFDAARRPDAVTEVAGSFPGFVPNADPGKGHWCPLGKTFIVDSQGEVYNCPSMTISEVNIGNARTNTLKELGNGFKNQAGREQMVHRRYAVEECERCAWRNFCQGGCTAFMAHQSGSLFINDEYCEFRRDLYREYVLRSALG
jgi:radical SAM protein with 4Fe4S-binding SPASM domain